MYYLKNLFSNSSADFIEKIRGFFVFFPDFH